MTTLTRRLTTLLLLSTFTLSTACATTTSSASRTPLQPASSSHATFMDHDEEESITDYITPHELNEIPVILR